MESRNILVIGPDGGMEKMQERIMARVQSCFNIKKVLEASSVGQLDQWLNRIDGVLLMPALGKEKRDHVLSVCQEAGCPVILVPELYDILLTNSRVVQMDDLALLEIRNIGFTLIQRMAKRALDLFISIPGLLLFAPLMIICALLIGITSPGPVFIIQSRVGRDGREYGMYKLRTMIKDAEKTTGPVLASENDPRITPVGRMLRAARIDELPQLFNVLRGEMSFVGPRPERPHFVEKYNRELPGYRFRHAVKPGITGMAQIAGRYTTSSEDKLRFDLYYIRNYSLLLDLRIILQTIPVILCHERSVGVKSDYGRNPVVNRFIINEIKEPALDHKKGAV